MDIMQVLAQSTINVMAYFLPAFSIILVVSWVCSLFRFNR